MARLCGDPDRDRREPDLSPGLGEHRGRGRRAHAAELRRRLVPAALLAGAGQHRVHGGRHGAAGSRAGGAARLGLCAHRHALPRLHQALRAGGLHHPALSRSRRLGAARGAELGLAQQGLDVDDRRVAGHLQHLQFDRPDHDHGAPPLLLHLRVHVVGARTRLVGDGGRGQHPRRRARDDRVQDHVSADPAGHHWWPDHHLPAVDRALCRAGHHRDPRALSGRDDAAHRVLLEQPGGPRCRLLAAAAADHDGDARRAALAPAAQGLHGRRRQGRRAARGQARAPGAG